MLVHLRRLRPGAPPLAEADTPYGPAVAVWRGGPAAPPGWIEVAVPCAHAELYPYSL
ncbi:hypothetical protein ACFV6F_05675 [Kitasatospora phosalacinea]|uniref:hypothetical protein n=1 Tax=Kitasatospora phosalacinea TaxID=2065 RepID=UPI00364DA58C